MWVMVKVVKGGKRFQHHASESWHPEELRQNWIPAYAGMMSGWAMCVLVKVVKG